MSFLVALLAHAVGGFFNEEGAPLTVTREWTTLDETRQVRLLGVETDTTASGKTKQVHARLEIRHADGRVEPGLVEYNGPWSSGLGSQLLLIAQVGRAPGVMTFSVGDQRCSATEGGGCLLSGRRLEVVSLHEGGHWGGRPAAVLRVTGADGQPQSFPLLVGNTQRLAAGDDLRFESVEAQAAAQLRYRRAPGNAVAAVSALLLALGLALMGRRWLV